MLKSRVRGYAAVVSLGLMTGLGGCLVIGGGAEGGNDAICVVDYDECLDLGVDEGICEAIYEACEGEEGGEEGGTGGDDGGMGCWDEVQQCLEANNGDEQQCADIIEWCQGNDDGGDEDPGDDGNGCWEQVQWCYETMQDPQECEALAEMCGGVDDGGDDGNNCEEILWECGFDPDNPEGPQNPDDIPPECWEAYEQCVGGGEDDGGCNDPDVPGCCDAPAGECCEGMECDQCEVAYGQCLEAGVPEDQCWEEYLGCSGQGDDDGNPPPEDVCWDVAELACQYQGMLPDEEDTCQAAQDTCQQGDPAGCTFSLFSCNDLEYGDIEGLVAAANGGNPQFEGCASEYAQCVQ